MLSLVETVEGTVHALFIFMALRKRLRRMSKHNYPTREMITLLIMLDLSLWFEKTTTTTKHEANPFQLAFYHVISWSIIAAIATPLQIFFRFHASVCLSHVWANMYRLPVYEVAVPRDL
jgi:peptidoglycan biosynthesis protein MviN/MurJ (putative lipid II flippase)